jgi:GH24 family phage-related lysozyme (muramidase)
MNDTQNKALIATHEGRRLVAYADTRGFKTIGVGFNLDAPGAAAVCSAAGVDFEQVRAGAMITDQQCDAIFELQYEAVAAEARKILSQIDSFPDNAGAVICDMLFQLGTAGFLEFRHAIIAFGLKDWTGAIAAIKASALATEVPNRVKDNISLLEAIA